MLNDRILILKQKLTKLCTPKPSVNETRGIVAINDETISFLTPRIPNPTHTHQGASESPSTFNYEHNFASISEVKQNFTAESPAQCSVIHAI
jgi:hypothetical protein